MVGCISCKGVCVFYVLMSVCVSCVTFDGTLKDVCVTASVDGL